MAGALMAGTLSAEPESGAAAGAEAPPPTEGVVGGNGKLKAGRPDAVLSLLGICKLSATLVPGAA